VDGCAGASASITGDTQHGDFFASYGPQNGQSYISATFTGTVNGTSLTVSDVTKVMAAGIAASNTLTGSGVPPGCAITSGGPTTWTLNQNCGSHSGSMSTMVRPPWNVAGADYPVGAAASGLTPVTPSTCPVGATSCWVDKHGFLEVHYSGGNVDIENYDFSANGAYGLDVYGGTGSCTFKNLKFAFGTNLKTTYNAGWGLTSRGAAAYIYMESGNSCTSFTLDHIYADGGANNGDCCNPNAMPNILAFPGGATFLHDVTVQPTVTYSAFENFNERLNFPCGATVQYNFFHNQNYNSGNHGNWTFMGGGPYSAASIHCPLAKIEHNTALNDPDFIGGMTAVWTIYDGNHVDPMMTVDVASISYNTTILNAEKITLTSLSRRLVGVSTTGPSCLVGTIGSFNSLGTSPHSFSAALGVFQGTHPASNCDGAGTGTYTYTGTLARPLSIGSTLYWSSGISEIGLFANHQGAISCLNNYTDPTGSLFLWNARNRVGCTNGATTMGSYTNIGNINMNLNAQAN
jgi:hypothetical protein